MQSRREHLISRYIPSCPVGGSIDSDCAFEGDYGVPPLSMTEGMQHIRLMEGVSRSLPSSPLLTHQTIGVRLQPVKKLTGKDAAVAGHSQTEHRCEYAAVTFLQTRGFGKNGAADTNVG